jgi:hypothetical protein
MLRSPITLNRTDVQQSPEMKQSTTRQLLPTPATSGRSRAPLLPPRIQPKLLIRVRLFKA